MKKLFVTMLIALVSMSALAQNEGKKAIGVNLLYGTKIKEMGFGVKGQYYATNVIRAELNADYFMKNSDFDGGSMRMWDVNLVGHYLVDVAQEKAFIYPLVGVGLTNWSHSIVSNKVKFAINVGAGFQFDVAEDFTINAEAKYQVIDQFDQAVFSIGCAYRF